MAAAIITVHNYALLSEAHPGCIPKCTPESTFPGMYHMGYEHIMPWHINVQRFLCLNSFPIIKNISNWKYYYVTD